MLYAGVLSKLCLLPCFILLVLSCCGSNVKFSVAGHSKGSDKSEPGGKKNKFKNRKSELKNPDQIMKARKLKAKKQAFQKQRHNQKVKRQSVAKQKGNR